MEEWTLLLLQTAQRAEKCVPCLADTKMSVICHHLSNLQPKTACSSQPRALAALVPTQCWALSSLWKLKGSFESANSNSLTVAWKETEGNGITFLKEHKLQKGPNYHFVENELPCVKMRPKGETKNEGWGRGRPKRHSGGWWWGSVWTLGSPTFDVSEHRCIE